MKKALPYIIGLVLITAVILLVLSGGDSSQGGSGGGSASQKWSKADTRITLRKNDKKPYGLYVAYERLQDIFPKAAISTSRSEPGQWDSIAFFGSNQAVIIFSPRVMASRHEFRNLVRFAESGNDVFISTLTFSSAVTSYIGMDVDYSNISWFSDQDLAADTMTETLSAPWNGQYTYLGKRMEGYFDPLDTLLATPLGRGHDGRINFIHLKAGKGNLYVHLSPLAFSNYFLLRKGNIGYYEKALSVINPDVTHVVWDEYFISNRPGDSREQSSGNNWFSSMAKNRELLAALLIAIGLLLLYTLLGMRRRQRAVPFQPPLRNDSLDFVKTIGRLYFEKGDHTNLARKMTVYFLEHIRSRYQLATGTLNDEFIKSVVERTGVPEQEVRSIVHTAQALQGNVSVTDKQLEIYYRQLEKFYQQA